MHNNNSISTALIFLLSGVFGATRGKEISYIRKSISGSSYINKNDTIVNSNRLLYTFNSDPRTVEYKYFLDSTGIKTSGNGWSVWDGKSPLHADEDTCKNKAVFTGAERKAKLPMCVHERDVVSANIQSKGRFVDCDELVTIWNKVAKDDGKMNIFLDIGANIGACTMEMLVSTNAHIISFEPTPINLSKLTSTLINNKSYMHRVAVFPIGLSDVPGSSVINTAKGNLGNSVIDVIVKDVNQQQFYDPVAIQLDTLDSLFQSFDYSKFSIPLIKMDVQGYECHVVNGGKQFVFKNAHAFKTEFIEKWFLPHGCSEDKLQYLFEVLGFELTKQGPHDVVGYNKNVNI